MGTDVAVPLHAVVEAREQKIRRLHLGGHDSQLVIATGSGQIGFLLDDPAGWAAAVTAARGRWSAPQDPEAGFAPS